MYTLVESQFEFIFNFSLLFIQRKSNNQQIKNTIVWTINTEPKAWESENTIPKLKALTGRVKIIAGKTQLPYNGELG